MTAKLLLTPSATSAADELTSREARTQEEVAAQLSAGPGRPSRYRAARLGPTARLGAAAHASPGLGELMGWEPGTLRAFRERERTSWLHRARISRSWNLNNPNLLPALNS